MIYEGWRPFFVTRGGYFNEYARRWKLSFSPILRGLSERAIDEKKGERGERLPRSLAKSVRNETND